MSGHIPKKDIIAEIYRIWGERIAEQLDEEIMSEYKKYCDENPQDENGFFIGGLIVNPKEIS